MPLPFPSEQSLGGPRQFVTTHWSVVLGAIDSSAPGWTTAMEKLCQAYWYPLYAYVRRRAYSPEDAQDLTQEFFARLLSQCPSGKSQLAGVDRNKGKFRSWLLGVMNHFLAHEWEKVRAQKRGGGKPQFSFDSVSAEDRYRIEPLDPTTPERLFERRWAFTVLAEAAARLRVEYQAADKEDLYSALKDFVSVEAVPASYEEAARHLNMSTGAVKSAIHRLRQRYQELVREEIAQTVTTTSEVDDEIRYLLTVIRD